MELSEHDAVDRSEGKAEEPKPLTFEEASQMKIGFGKHKGMTLIDIIDKHPDGEMDFEKIVDETKIATIRGLLEKTNSPEGEFLKFYKLERLEDMTIDTFTRAMRALEKKLEKMSDFTGTPFEELPI